MNKPVAWYKKDSNDYLIENIGQLDFQVQEFIDAGYIPLYTRPHSEESVKVKELTDEEIDFIFFDLPSGHSIQEFARAILRKAQEK